MGADLLILDEMAFMNPNDVFQVIFPMLRVNHAAMIGISTHQPGMDLLWGNIIKQKMPDGTPRFTTFMYLPSCAECTLTHPEKFICEHHIPPPWIKLGDIGDIQALYGDNAEDMNSELFGRRPNTGEGPLLNDEEVLALSAFNENAIDIDRDVGYIVVGVDPAAGNHCYAVVAGAPIGGNFVVRYYLLLASDALVCRCLLLSSRLLRSWQNVVRGLGQRAAQHVFCTGGLLVAVLAREAGAHDGRDDHVQVLGLDRARVPLQHGHEPRIDRVERRGRVRGVDRGRVFRRQQQPDKDRDLGLAPQRLKHVVGRRDERRRLGVRPVRGEHVRDVLQRALRRESAEPADLVRHLVRPRPQLSIHVANKMFFRFSPCHTRLNATPGSTPAASCASSTNCARTNTSARRRSSSCRK